MKSRTWNNSPLLKQEFLKKWIKGVQTYSSLNKNMTVSDRKNAIKLSADVAIASTRNEATNWSRALMRDAVSSNRTNRIVVERILGRRVEEKSTAAASISTHCSKRIVRRSRGFASRRTKATRVVPKRLVPGVGKTRSSFSIAKKLVKKRTSVLKRLVPGGERMMDEFSLIRETLDYIVSLRVQVDVMRHYLCGAAAQRSETSNI